MKVWRVHKGTEDPQARVFRRMQLSCVQTDLNHISIMNHYGSKPVALATLPYKCKD